MNKLIILFFFVIFPINFLHCMKRQRDADIAGSEMKRRKIQEISLCLDLPNQLKKKIIIEHLLTLATNHRSFDKVCKTIKALSLVSHDWNAFINNPCNTYHMINRLSIQTKLSSNDPECERPLRVNRYMIAKAISTYGAKNYIQQSETLYHKVKKDSPIPFSIKELVAKGADVNYKHSISNCLSIAVKIANYIYIKELLKYGANSNVISKENKKTLLARAKKEKDEEMISLLSTHQ